MTDQVGRVLLVVGGIGGLLITPPFALAYHRAYPMPGEEPAPWVAALEPFLLRRGLLAGSRPEDYARYGVGYGVALLLVTAGLAVLVVRRRDRRAWSIVALGSALATVGTFGDYGAFGTGFGPLGFLVQNVGWLVLAAGTVILAVSLRRQRRSPWRWTIAVAASGMVTIIAGTVLVGHLPSGPGLLVLVGAIAAGLGGLPRDAVEAVNGTADATGRVR